MLLYAAQAKWQSLLRVNPSDPHTSSPGLDGLQEQEIAGCTTNKAITSIKKGLFILANFNTPN